jgi:hypothetical protein
MRFHPCFRVIGALLLASMLNACTDDEEAKCKAAGGAPEYVGGGKLKGESPQKMICMPAKSK